VTSAAQPHCAIKGSAFIEMCVVLGFDAGGGSQRWVEISGSQTFLAHGPYLRNFQWTILL